ncbi:MAG: galactokinase family protein, partial [Lachnospiraceae bacterium]|nr:galactokinase family protein [Lachnospiraceae bacterium]
MSDFIREDIKTRLKNAFQEQFGTQDMDFISAPGRVELLGNHTDHQRGKVLAASVDLKAYAAFAPNGTDLVNIVSEGHSTHQIKLNDLMPDVSEFGSAKSIV